MGLEAQLAAAKAAYESLGALIDRCSIISRAEAPDGFGGLTITETVLASNVECLYEERTHSTSQVAGGPLSYVTHHLHLYDTAINNAIQTDHKIVVAARGNRAQMTFEQPVRTPETFDVGVHLDLMFKV